MGTGSADITLTVGPVSKTFRMTVGDEQRVPMAVMPEQLAMTYVIGGAGNTMLLRVYDQYGDPFVGNAETVAIRVYLPTGITGFSSQPIFIDTSLEPLNLNGECKLNLTGATTGIQPWPSGLTKAAAIRSRRAISIWIETVAAFMKLAPIPFWGIYHLW